MNILFRILNLELMWDYGANTWKIYNTTLQTMLEQAQKQLLELRQARFRTTIFLKWFPLENVFKRLITIVRMSKAKQVENQMYWNRRKWKGCLRNISMTFLCFLILDGLDWWEKIMKLNAQLQNWKKKFSVYDNNNHRKPMEQHQLNNRKRNSLVFVNFFVKTLEIKDQSFRR